MKDIIRMNQLAGIITEGQARKMMTILNEDENMDLMSFIKNNKSEIIKQLNQQEAKNRKAKTIDFEVSYEDKNKVYAERDYLPIGEEDETMTSLDEISFSETAGKHEIIVNGKKLKYSIFDI